MKKSPDVHMEQDPAAVSMEGKFRLLAQLLSPRAESEEIPFVPIILARKDFNPSEVVEVIFVGEGTTVTITPRDGGESRRLNGMLAVNELLKMGWELKLLALVARPFGDIHYKLQIYHDLMAVLVFSKDESV